MRDRAKPAKRGRSAMRVRAGAGGAFAGLTALVALVAALAATSAGAAVPDGCGLTTEPKIARAFGLSEAIMHRPVLSPPGSESGVVRIGCRAFAWSGQKPSNEKGQREALLEGRLARLNVDTWVTDQGPNASVWRAHFDSELKTIRSASVGLFLKRLHGRAFVPPRYEADEAIAYEASTARVTKVRALWWKRSEKSLIELNVEEARGRPALASLKRIAGVIVYRFNTE
jgi:hypothetical protein